MKGGILINVREVHMTNGTKLTAQLEFSPDGTLVGILLNVNTDEKERLMKEAIEKLIDPITLERVCAVYKG